MNTNNLQSLVVELISDWKKFEPLKQEYDQFINGDLNISAAIQSYQFDWMSAVNPLNIEANMSPYFLLVRDAGKLVGFAPLMKETNPWSKGWFTRLRIWGEHISPLSNTCPDFICQSGSEELVIRSIRNYLFGDGKHDWDVLEFRFYSDINVSHPMIEKYFPSAKWQDEHTDCFTFILPDEKSSKEKDNLFSHLSSKRRSDIRRSERRFKEAYPDMAFNCYTQINEKLFSQIAIQHSERQQKLSVDGHQRDFLYENPTQRQVMWDLLKTAEENHWLKIYTIERPDELIAFNIIFRQQKTSIGYQMSFDQKYAKFSPSFLLGKYSIETEFEQKQTNEINFLPLKTKFKETFSNQSYSTFCFRQINDRNLMSGVRIFLWAVLRVPSIVISKLN